MSRFLLFEPGLTDAGAKVEGKLEVSQRTKSLLVFAVLLGVAPASLVMATEEDQPWLPIGPFVSDVRALAVEEDGNGSPTVARVYAGTFGEGVFWSDDGGLAWTLGTGTADRAVTSLVINPMDSTIVYAGTRLMGVFESSDSGVTWAQTSLGGSITSLAIDPATPATLYAGTISSGVFKSENGGTTWGPCNIGLGNLEVLSLAIDELSPAYVYAGTDTGGVFLSADGCDNWAPINSELSNRVVRALDIDENADPALSIIYAGTDGGGVFKKDDAAADWGLFGLDGETIFTLAINPDDPAILYAGTDSNVFKHDDGFSVVDNGLEGLRIPAVAIDPDNSEIVYAATRGGGVFKTIDGAANWFVTSFDLGGRIGVFVETVEVDPQASDTLYAGTFQGGVFKSTDMGGTWTSSNVGLPDFVAKALVVNRANPNILCVGTVSSSVYKSVDAAASWAPTALPLGVVVEDLQDDPSDPDVVYATGGFIYRSDDACDTWMKISTTPVELAFANVLAVDPSAPNTLYAGTQKGGVYKTTDGGLSWGQCNSGLTDSFVRTLAIKPDDPDVLFAGTNSGGIFKTDNGCSSWVASNSGLDAADMNVQAIAIDPLNPATVYAGTFSLDGKGVYRSTDCGVTWVACETGLTNQKVRALTLDPGTPSNVYAGTDGAGIYKMSGPAIIVDPTFDLETSEDGGSSKLSVSLATASAFEVTVPLSSSDIGEGIVEPADLIFGPGVTALEATVIGVADAMIDGDQEYMVQVGPASSADPEYNGLSGTSAVVTNLNIDEPSGETLETATLGTTGELPGSGFPISVNVFSGAKFTFTEEVRVLGVGAHLVAESGDIFVALVPLVGGLPTNDAFDLVDAVFSSPLTPPNPSEEVRVSADLMLGPGEYGLFFGSGRLGTSGVAWLPETDTEVGNPEYFFGDPGIPQWFENGPENARFFIDFEVINPDLIFADGFERGNTTAWECLPPIMASFTVEEDFGGDPQTIRVTDTSMGGVSEWLWDFDDLPPPSTTSEDQVPFGTGVFQYNEPGNYTVSLTVRRGEVCVDTASVLVDAN